MIQSSNSSASASSSRYYQDHDSVTFKNSRTSTNSTISGNFAINKKNSPSSFLGSNQDQNVKKTPRNKTNELASTSPSTNTLSSNKKKKNVNTGCYLTFDKNLLSQIVESEKLLWGFRQEMNRSVSKAALPCETLLKILV